MTNTWNKEIEDICFTPQIQIYKYETKNKTKNK